MSSLYAGADTSSGSRDTHRFNVILNDYKSIDFTSEVAQSLSISADQITLKSIFPSLNIYNLIIEADIDITVLESLMLKSKYLKAYEKDVKTTSRSTRPNDIDFNEQWNLELIGVPDAWDITTGGVTSGRKKIVVAIIDDGYDIDHEDLQGNIWTNEAEIPFNQIDDDDNGYVDDYYGVNTRDENGEFTKRTHGTAVAGIIGAKGNNEIGISGINWDIQLMLISGQAFVSDIIESYNYVLTQRKLYNESNGTKGAFVVATNFSSGIDEAFARDYPVWCEIYDALGLEGVLSVTAAPNNGKDVDYVGDMPSTCNSNFLIVVNNLLQTELLADDSGFGMRNIDISAPGDDAPSLSLQNGYNNFNGTSSAAPHVAGAIGLLYSVPIQEIDELVIRYPGNIAASIKDAILTGSKQLADLRSKSVSGGRLDIGASIKKIQNVYDSDSSLGLIVRPNPVSNDIGVRFLVPDNEDYSIIIYNTIGEVVYRNDFEAKPFDLDSLFISVRDYQNGQYFIQLISDTKKLTKAFTVMH